MDIVGREGPVTIAQPGVVRELSGAGTALAASATTLAAKGAKKKKK